MPAVLYIEHAVRDFDAWKRAFDSDPVGREQNGVRRYRVTYRGPGGHSWVDRGRPSIEFIQLPRHLGGCADVPERTKRRRTTAGNDVRPPPAGPQPSGRSIDSVVH